MAKVTVKVNFDRHLKALGGKNLNDKRTLKLIGREVVKMMKSDISKGKSPVKGVGRFESYASQRLGSGYPDTVKKKYPGKRKRPVNLELSGQFLKHLNYKARSGKYVLIGMMNASAKLLKMFDTHNDGTHRHVPQRKFLPTGEGDQFTSRISREIKNIYLKRIKNIINKLNSDV